MQAKAGNGVMVAGTATKDAEYKTIGEKETPLASFSLVVSARGETAAYANCKAFGGALASYARNIKKGDAVFAVGVLETREYNGKQYSDLNCQWLNFVGKSGAAAAPSSTVPDAPAVSTADQISFEDSPDDDDDLPF